MRTYIEGWRAALAAAAMCLPATAASTAVLENSKVRVVFDGAQGGAIVSFVDRQTGRDFAASGAGPIYELVLGAAPSRRISARDAGAVVLKSSRAKGSQSVGASVKAHGTTAVGTQWSCTLAEGASAISCRIRIANRSSLGVTSVAFPVLAMPLHLGDRGNDDRLLLPRCDGYVVENPEQMLREGEYRSTRYPDTASVQLLAYYDDTAGLYAATQDPEGRHKTFGFVRSSRTLGLQVRHEPEFVPHADVNISYPTVIGVIHGDWQAAADEYKAWAVHQPWCRRTLLERTDIPDWVKRAPLFYTVSLRGKTPDGQDGYRGPFLAENTAEWGKTLGTLMCPLIMGWEKQGRWTTPDYFPPKGGAEAFQELTRQFLAAGYHSMVYLSGLNYTLRKTGKDVEKPPMDETERFAAEAERYALVGEDGKVRRTGKVDTGVGEHAVLCPGTTYTRQLMVGIARECARLGVEAVQLDQALGGAVPMCYAAGHGHPPGGGTWSHRAMYRLLEQMRAAGKERSKDAIFSIEEPGELYIQTLDLYHARDYAEGRFPRDARGAVGVPLFTYLYHEYSLGYGGQLALSARASPFTVMALALNVINGKIPGAASWDSILPARDVHPDQAQMLRAGLELMRTPARDYLLFGKRLHTEPLPVADLDIPVPVSSGGKVAEERRRFRGVLHSGWMLPDGRIGYVAVNIGKQKLTLELPVKGVGDRAARYRLRTFTAARPEPTEMARKAGLPYQARIELPPLAPVFVEADPEF
jgi:hypothetical protein